MSEDEQVLIIGRHPWAGHIGTVIGIATFECLPPMAKVKLTESGHECFAEPRDLKPLDRKQHRRWRRLRDGAGDEARND